MKRKYAKQKRITAKTVEAIQASVELEEYGDAILVVEYYKVSPLEWRYIINHLDRDPKDVAAIIKAKRKNEKRRLKEAGKL